MKIKNNISISCNMIILFISFLLPPSLLYAANDGHGLYEICVKKEHSNIREVNSCTMLISGLAFGLIHGEIYATDSLSNDATFNKNYSRVKKKSFCSGGVNIGLIFQQTLSFIKKPRNKKLLNRDIAEVVFLALREKWPGPCK